MDGVYIPEKFQNELWLDLHRGMFEAFSTMRVEDKPFRFLDADLEVGDFYITEFLGVVYLEEVSFIDRFDIVYPKSNLPRPLENCFKIALIKED